MIVHILAFGAALCGMEGVPGNWSRGHKWVSFFMPQWREEATCEACLKRAHEKHRNA